MLPLIQMIGSLTFSNFLISNQNYHPIFLTCPLPCGQPQLQRPEFCLQNSSVSCLPGKRNARTILCLSSATHCLF